MSRKYNIVVRLPFDLKRAQMEERLLAIPGVRRDEDGRFSHYQDGLDVPTYQVDLGEIESEGHILLSLEAEDEQDALELVHALTGQILRDIPVGPTGPMAIPVGQVQMQSEPASQALLSSRTELLPARGGESGGAGPIFVVIFAVLPLVAWFIMLLLPGLRQLHQLLFGLLLLIELAIAIIALLRRGERPKES